MQPSTTLTHASQSSFRRPQREVAGSKSLASMLPTILTTGVITLVITAIMRLVWVGFNNDFFGAWMEAWLTTWPIAFPLAYMSKPLIKQVTNRLTHPVVDENTSLSVSHIDAASANATAKNRLQIQRTGYISRYD
ncbi:MAG: DUF2798 domain-containing protein [Undibacterium sp.]|uniref:DUF2798 domain-containing protein n=1 Tax=Undibacterium sp. TaxID=1914977 RepID=UPI002724DCA5|nr:DUF2798 domain-containing protein [Undibacterium sp.]MDO8652520.1 DUF2798 domain-containing protein [Undibacterium sp.]